jgi:hypothetical protein
MEYMDEGSNGRVYRLANGKVQKVAKRRVSGHDIETQKRIHMFLEKVQMRYIRVPALMKDKFAEHEYCMEAIDTSTPVAISEENPEMFYEFLDLWKKAWMYGFGLLDFELYRQPNGKYAIIDFDKTAFRITGGSVEDQFKLPFPYNPSRTSNSVYFAYPCFPANFLELLVGEQGTLEEKYKRLADMPYYQDKLSN